MMNRDLKIFKKLLIFVNFNLSKMFECLKCYQPPITNDKSMHQQTKLRDASVEELKKLRKPPKYTLVQRIPQIFLFLAVGVIRALISLVYSLIAGTFFIIVCTFWKSIGSPESWRRPLKLLWAALARILLFLLGIYQINYHGQPDSDARFIISNHTCFFDGWLFLPLLPRPLDKIELLEIPCYLEMWNVFEGISVDRTRSCGMTKVLLDSATNSNRPMIQMFPEGATTNGDYMLKFHLGAFLSDLPLQPAAIRYTLWGTTKKISHLSYFHNYPSHWIEFLCIPAITVDIEFLPTVSLKRSQENDPRQFADDVSLMIANFLGVPILNLTSNTIYKVPQQKKRRK
ncbi:hypothetical protein TRFO_30816 [Tritrichomonas foetus]|uniref:Phospholipid/glycerol acyltransferase domain-containing protein n=1 Tax=Tritrichomonas foetus TaxID=1144522 RepID=A0A1J4JST4_9EUKA|nr:hypothetical protein TRFO_30816 [Tritrichomonas foetus]|eukprot:OHT02191.1 hypothetical protein TRFO_30816 [Tritrichomonas foetus]